MRLKTILKSDILYYIAVILLVINVVNYVRNGSLECLILLAVAVYISHQFSKNYSIDILVGLLVANLLFYCGALKEGLANGTPSCPTGQKFQPARCISVGAGNGAGGGSSGSS